VQLDGHGPAAIVEIDDDQVKIAEVEVDLRGRGPNQAW